jgi:D-glycero-D-manno-heptose 1,7-bisphosphate phosphatase
MAKAKVIFLDRDGTINIDRGYVHKVEEWQWVTGAIEALKKLQDAGFRLTIITNQGGIAYGYYSEEDLRRLHNFMNQALAKAGVTLSAIAYCPHGQEAACACRKPRTGMADQIEKQIGPIDYQSSWTIGDKIADLEFGKKLKTHTSLLRSKYWSENELPRKPDHIVNSLLEAAAKIVSL